MLIREDGRFLYTLPSVVDDIDFAITHIIRGEDHVTNTAAQIEIFEALGAAVPLFAHYPAADRRGRRGAVEAAGLAVAALLREDGIEPLAVDCYLAKTGTSDSDRSRSTSLDVLAAEFAFEKIGRAPAHFDPAELSNLNAKLLHALPYDAVEPRLDGAGHRRRRGVLGRGASPTSRGFPM